MIVMPQHEQAAANKVVEFALLIGEPAWLHRNRGRNYGVMVADLAVVDITLTQRTFSGSRSQLLPVGSGNSSHDFGNRLRNVGGEIAAVSPGIADEFVLLVERLGQIECLLRAEAVETVGMPLQFSEVIQQGRQHTHCFRVQALDGGLARPCPRYDLVGLLAIWGQSVVRGCIFLFAGLGVGTEPGTVIALL